MFNLEYEPLAEKIGMREHCLCYIDLFTKYEKKGSQCRERQRNWLKYGKYKQLIKQTRYNNVNEFLAAAKEEQKKQTEKVRERTLIEAGLFTQAYYDGSMISKPLPVSDEEYEEVKKVIDSGINPYSSKKKVARGDEGFLTGLAWCILVIGIVASIVCLATLAVNPYGDFVLWGFLVAIGVLVSSLICFALMKVIANISTTLKQIQNREK